MELSSPKKPDLMQNSESDLDPQDGKSIPLQECIPSSSQKEILPYPPATSSFYFPTFKGSLVSSPLQKTSPDPIYERLTRLPYYAADPHQEAAMLLQPKRSKLHVSASVFSQQNGTQTNGTQTKHAFDFSVGMNLLVGTAIYEGAFDHLRQCSNARAGNFPAVLGGQRGGRKGNGEAATGSGCLTCCTIM